MDNTNNFVIEDGILHKYIGAGGEVAIPETIHTIGRWAFYNCITVTKISIPETVSKIDRCAFKGCTSLKAISIPNSVTHIDNEAFSNCTALSDVSIPKGICGRRLFSGCISLCDKNGFVIINNTLYDYIGSCSSLVIPEGVEEICPSTFYGNEKIKTVHLPSSLKKIHDFAFADCIKLQTVTFPDGLESIGYRAFSACYKLRTAVVPEKCVIGKRAFSGCKALMNDKQFIIVNGILFGYCGSETEITFPDNVYKIDDLQLSNKLMLSLSKVILPDSIQQIESTAFRGCKNLADANGFVIVKNTLCDYFGKSKTIKIPNGIQTIGFFVFEDRKIPPKSILFPLSVSTIEESAFSRCDITELILPPTIKNLGHRAFSVCQQLTKIQLSENVHTIPESCFEGCSSLRRIKIPSGVMRVEENAFAATPLEDVYFAGSTTEIAACAFGSKPSPALTIHAPMGSCAEQYAKKMNIKFMAENILSVENQQYPIAQKAMQAFVTQAEEMDDLLYGLGYNTLFPSDIDHIAVTLDNKFSPVEVEAFFDMVEAYLKSNGIGFDAKCGMTVEKIKDQCKEGFQHIIDGCRNGSKVDPPWESVRACIAVGLACYYFLSSKTSMEVNWYRDKWEQRGDYRSAQTAAYCVSATGGKVTTKNHRAYTR